MKKISLFLIMFLFFGLNSVAFAQKEGGFAGVSIVNSAVSGETKAEYPGIATILSSISDQEITFGLQGGYYFQDWRAYVSYEKASFEDVTASTILLMLDRVGLIGTSSVDWYFIGLGFGNVQVRYEERTPGVEVEKRDFSGTTFALEFGGMRTLSDNLEIEYGYRHVPANLEFKSVTTTAVAQGQGTLTLDKLSRLWIGLNYLF